MKALSEEYQTSQRNIYYYAETRNTWQPVFTQLFDLDKDRLMVINRYDFLYRQASLHFQTASDAQKPLYLSHMIDGTERMVALLGLETLRESQEGCIKVAEIEKQVSKHKAFLEALSRQCLQ